MVLLPTRPSARGALAVVCLVALVALAGCSFQYSGSFGDDGPDNDPDDDGLTTELENEIGTDPDDPDTDGDRLLDGWEYNNETDEGALLPDADPLHKDLYMQVIYAAGIDSLSATERENVVDIWASMNVSNPDGEQGIAFHLDDDSPHGGPVDISESLPDDSDEYHTEQYTEYVPAERQCVYHQSLFLNIDQDVADTGGYGSAPGFASVVAGQRIDEFSRERQPAAYNVRERSLTHELLHNIVGEVGDTGDYHTTNGWLATGYDDVDDDTWTDRYDRLSNPTAAQLSSDGFKDATDATARLCADSENA